MPIFELPGRTGDILIFNLWYDVTSYASVFLWGAMQKYTYYEKWSENY